MTSFIKIKHYICKVVKYLQNPITMSNKSKDALFILAYKLLYKIQSLPKSLTDWIHQPVLVPSETSLKLLASIGYNLKKIK